MLGEALDVAARWSGDVVSTFILSLYVGQTDQEFLYGTILFSHALTSCENFNKYDNKKLICFTFYLVLSCSYKIDIMNHI